MSGAHLKFAGLRAAIRSRLWHVVSWLNLRKITFFALMAVVVFSAGIFVLELTPSRQLLNTTFIASIETQNVSMRVGLGSATIAGISGTSISGHDQSIQAIGTEEITDLTQLGSTPKETNSNSFSYSSASSETHLELDELVIPPNRAIEFASSGIRRFLSVQAIIEDGTTPFEVIVVWKGPIVSEAADATTGALLGSERWLNQSPLIEFEGVEIDGLVYSPIAVTGLSLETLRASGRDQITASSVLSGEVQFDILGYRSKSTTLRPGEFFRFSGLSAQLTNLTLTENGLRFVLIGNAESIKLGFLNNLRNIHPSLLDFLRSIDSLGIVVSSLFAFFLAAIGALSLGKTDEV